MRQALIVTSFLSIVGCTNAPLGRGFDVLMPVRSEAVPGAVPGARTAGEVPVSQIGVGAEFGAGADATGALFHGEWEFALGERLALAARLLHFTYTWEGEGDFTDDAEEDGEGTGVGAEVRFYPRRAFDGFYVGAGIGLFPIAEWEYTDGSLREEGDDVSFAGHASLGYCIRTGRSFAITPTLIIGSYVSDSPESGPFGGLGLSFNFGL